MVNTKTETIPNPRFKNGKAIMSNSMMQGGKTIEKPPDDFGVLYFVDENPEFHKMLKMSIQSLKRFHPDWPIHVMECDSYRIPFRRKVYRAFSFWKRKARYDRAGQDSRVFVDKAWAWIDTPFEHTLFLDVDTIIMRPLEDLRAAAAKSDVMIMPLDWKQYEGIESWHPKKFPYLMVGVMFYNRVFLEVYRSYLERMSEILPKIAMPDQYLVSLICYKEASNLKLAYNHSLQVDVINMDQELGTGDYPRIGGCLDLRWEGLSNFHIFHYNEYKPQYMKQIKEVWGYPLDE